jgi:PhnB protein
MEVTPYLHFDGKCAEAIEFYKQALNAKVEVVMRFKDGPGANDPNVVKPEQLNQVMHSSFTIGDTKILASDCGQSMGGFSLTLSVKSPAEVDRLCKALGEGGKVLQAPNETFFSPRFAVLDDRFGVNWILLVPQEMNANQKRETGTLASV